MGGTIEYETHWRRLIDRCRQHFDGPLTYAASWDEADRVEFWDAIDVVGVDAYFPITERADADRSDMLAGWQPWLQHLEALHQSSGRQVLLTEIGYRSIDGAGMHPYRFGDTGPYDPTEQADLYWAALEATGDVDVSITIHDLAGRLVRRLHDGRQAVGRYVGRWDGTDNHGHMLPAGVYLLQVALTTDSGSDRYTTIVHIAR